MFCDAQIPIHPDLRKYTLDLLREKTALSVVKEKARLYAIKRWGDLPGDVHYRFRLRDHDSSSLYRSLNKELGILPRSQAQDNLDKWFRAANFSPPDAILTASCMHYVPEVSESNQRFMLILSTPLQRQLAWKYGHKKQVLMDLTFGFSSARALLVILMVIDDTNKGLPIAQIIFTAKKEAKAVHADYNTRILDDMLRIFKEKMGTNKNGESFTFAVGTTDNDVRERTALDNNFPGVILILCMFHTLQSWRNHLNQSLASIPKGEKRQEVCSRLWKLLMKLIRTVSDYNEAVSLYNGEVEYFRKLGKGRGPGSAENKKQSQAALDFLNYLHSYIKLEDYWRSWSLAGAMEAARQLGVDVLSVARTTNHLESFNGRIKLRYFRDYEHSGRLPRIDYWVLILLTRVLPDFFASWMERRHQRAYYGAMRHAPSALPHDTSPTMSFDDGSPRQLGPVKSRFDTVAEAEDDARKFMDRAFKGFAPCSGHYAKAFAEEHKLAVMEFEMSFEEVGEVDEDDSEFMEAKDVKFLGGDSLEPGA
jgi:hypothetical protein